MAMMLVPQTRGNIFGANGTGFVKLSDAMLDQGVA
jgi:hypothetical protein